MYTELGICVHSQTCRLVRESDVVNRTKILQEQIESNKLAASLLNELSR